MEKKEFKTQMESPRANIFSQKHGKKFANHIVEVKHIYEDGNKNSIDINENKENIPNSNLKDFRNKLDKFNQIKMTSDLKLEDKLPQGFYDKKFDEKTGKYIWVQHETNKKLNTLLNNQEKETK